MMSASESTPTLSSWHSIAARLSRTAQMRVSKAEADHYSRLRKHLRKLDPSDRPELLLEGTIPSGGAIAAKAHYLALLDEPGSTPIAIKRARLRWETLEIRKREIASRMGEVEDLEQRIHAECGQQSVARSFLIF